MPWIDANKCTACEICSEKCPVGAILIDSGKAVIQMQKCIRCGTCHTVCPQKAVRHDRERIPGEVSANVAMTQQFMSACAQYLGDEKEKWKCLERMKKHFDKEKVVAEKTLEKLVELQNAQPL